MIKKFISFLTVLLTVQFVAAQAPSGYYSSTKGSSGRSLKTALHRVIAEHKDVGYKAVWKAFATTDVRSDGKIWDMYSNVTNYVVGRDQAGSYHGEGDVYNREHSFPKSWFNDKAPMHNDLYHLYPTDGYVNSMRSNYPFGETNNPKKTSKNGWSKLGPCSVPGYSGTVFEPNDEYKGDFARTYFYMATCYEDKISYFHSPMLAGNSYPAYTKWAINMLLRWAKEDPVSEKEMKRNNAVSKIQHNRNPYIDFPGLEQYVWGEKTSVAFDPDHYDGGDVNPEPNPGETEVAAPVFSLASGTVGENTVVTISTATSAATIHYTINGGAEQTGMSPVKYTVTSDVVIVAYAQLGTSKSQNVRATYTVSKEPIVGNGVYVKVQNGSELTVGNRYLIVCEEAHTALAENKKDVRNYVEVSISDNSIKTDVSTKGHPYALVLGESAGTYTLFDAASNNYLALTSNANKLHSVETVKGGEARWNIDIAGGIANITNVKYGERSIQYNAAAPRFATYTSMQKPVALFKEAVISAIECPVLEADGSVDVYTIDGRQLRDNVSKSDALKGLPHGFYVVGGLKVLVK